MPLIRELAAKEIVTIFIKIYDGLGRLVQTLLNENQSAGEHIVVWDGKNDTRKKMASGVYFYKLGVSDKFSQTKKLLLLK